MNKYPSGNGDFRFFLPHTPHTLGSIKNKKYTSFRRLVFGWIVLAFSGKTKEKTEKKRHEAIMAKFSDKRMLHDQIMLTIVHKIKLMNDT
jgi:hypothetical protein